MHVQHHTQGTYMERWVSKVHEQHQRGGGTCQRLFRLAFLVHMNVHVPCGLQLLPAALLPGLVCEAHLLSINWDNICSTFCIAVHVSRHIVETVFTHALAWALCPFRHLQHSAFCMRHSLTLPVWYAKEAPSALGVCGSYICTAPTTLHSVCSVACGRWVCSTVAHVLLYGTTSRFVTRFAFWYVHLCSTLRIAEYALQHNSTVCALWHLYADVWVTESQVFTQYMVVLRFDVEQFNANHQLCSNKLHSVLGEVLDRVA